ncbi:DUF1232 domain-containing protein [Oscillatoria sp. CS-180]|uniref:YkvA family protein n=1 Tax=Oscillatoria sp. CS-180 TaxID=3021720 RepID=UPI00232A90C2|nr:DUF1232 domain-containing protein [Oscillatoria sp. CS-180]MDB9527276.1 DUF1232 domain-containing protein [Oscillatoria sp. CS-180]
MKQSVFQRIYRSLLGHPIARWFVILGSIAYLVSPVDISPDAIPILGWVDDGVLTALLVTGVTEILLERRRNLKAAKSEAEISSEQTTVNTSASTVD